MTIEQFEYDKRRNLTRFIVVTERATKVLAHLRIRKVTAAGLDSCAGVTEIVAAGNPGKIAYALKELEFTDRRQLLAH